MADEKIVSLKKYQIKWLTEYQAKFLKKHIEPLLSEEEIPLLDESLGCMTIHSTKRKWGFIMLSPENHRAVLKLIREKAKHGNDTNHVYNIVLTYMDWDTGKIYADRETLAKDCALSKQRVSQSLTDLFNLGVLSRTKGHGNSYNYFMSPEVAWFGSEGERQNALKDVVDLNLFRANKSSLEIRPK